MSVVIVGGNERMERRYRDLCEEYGHTAKVFTKASGGVRNVGSPDLLILSPTPCPIKCFGLFSAKPKIRM